MQNVGCTEKEPSQMDTMLNSLDEQISRYYNIHLSIRSSRLTIQEDNPSPDNENNKLSQGSRFNPGIFNRFHILITRLSELNNDHELEAKLLADYL